MIVFKRTTPKEIDFIGLITVLDADLSERDGAEYAFYNQFNSSNSRQYALVAYSNRSL
ncbi:MAG: hypothetical protein QM485_05620 [Flavobacteriaceae bacterium]